MWKPVDITGRSLAALGVATAAAVVTVLGTSVPASAAEGTIVGAHAEGAIAGSYIVVLNNSAPRQNSCFIRGLRFFHS